MGRMLFHAPTPEVLPEGAVERAYLAGIEGVPWHCRNTWVDGILTVERATSESGSLYIPWEVASVGTRVLSTCSLMEQERPYCLATELARGTLHYLRGFANTVESVGMQIPPVVAQHMHAARRHFFSAITSPFCETSSAEASINESSIAIDQLCRSFSREYVARQHHRDGSQGAVVAARLDGSLPIQAERFLAAFNGALVPFRWRDLQPEERHIQWQASDAQVAWCRQHGLRIFGGPLIQLDPLHLPDWTKGCGADFDRLESYARNYVDRVTQRYQDDVDAWICAGRVNLPGCLNLNEEQKLRLAVTMIETVRRASPRTPVVIGFDQPWAEYLANEDDDLSPLYFADALVRADLGVAGIALEINLGYWPGGTQPRDLLELIRHLDRWCLLGIPLLALLTVPAAVDDPDACGISRVVRRRRSEPMLPAIDQSTAADLILCLATCTRLHAVIWNQWSDAEPHEFPHAGLIDAAGNERPALAAIASARRKYLC